MKNLTQSDQKSVDRPQSLALQPCPARLFVEVTTRCNLRCPMCSKQSPASGIVDGDMSDEIFSRILPAMANAEAVILNGIGEPLLHPHLARFIESARQNLPAGGWVGFQTNGQLLDAKQADTIVEAGIDKVCLSSDAVSAEIFQRMRKGGKRQAVNSAVAALAAAARRNGRRISLGLEFVATRHNVHELPLLLDWAAHNFIDFVIVTHMLPYHAQLVDSVAFDTSTDRAVAFFRQWKERAEENGIPFERYFDVFMKYQKSPAEERIANQVKEMIADGMARGIDLNVDRLLNRDEAMLERVRKAFGQAQEIATAAGIALQLPSLVPAHTRRCDFVEEGSLFVSWDGAVHPCYFLWHRYHCHIGGLVKHVRPQVFGRLEGQDILSIWNGPEFLAFRQGVVKYDFPFCYDCAVALCDYVQFEDFSQDCYISPVPCGACLWCTGLFRCLM